MNELFLPYFKDLLRTLEPYAEFWHLWKESDQCFLSSLEIQLIESYLSNGNYKKPCVETGISVVFAVMTVKEAKFKLTWRRHEFEDWQTRLLNNKTINRRSVRLNECYSLN